MSGKPARAVSDTGGGTVNVHGEPMASPIQRNQDMRGDQQVLF